MTKEQSYKNSSALFDILFAIAEEERQEILERTFRWLREIKEHQETSKYHDGRYK